MKTGCGHFQKSSQRGVVLVSAILMLLVLTVIALLAMALPAVQTRVAANTANAQIAFATTDGTARYAQAVLAGAIPTKAAFIADAGGLYFFDPIAFPVPRWAPWPGAAVVSPFSGGSSAPGTYIAEELHPIRLPGQSAAATGYGHAGLNPRVLRVTAQAVGASGTTVDLVQGTYHTSF
jgi:Tfp pilus assembly protein PilX